MTRLPRATDHRAARWLLCAALLGAGVPAPALAQGQARTVSEQLFLEGRALMQEKKFELACEKFRASYELDRTATGTLLNLALCHEEIGKVASAWAEFRQVAAESLGRREDRVQLAREHEQKLFPNLSRVIIDVSQAARVPQLRVVLDGKEPLAEVAWGTELPIDPGEHVIDASAPGKQPARVTFTIAPVADKKTVAVPVLVDAPVETKREAPPSLPPPPPAHRPSVLPWVLGGAGLASIGVGVAFGVIASNRNADAKDLCPNDVCASEAIKRRASQGLSRADDAANVANVTVGVGAALVVAGAIVLLTDRPSAKPASVQVGASPLRGGGAFYVGGRL